MNILNTDHIKLIVSEVDGIITDGTLYMDELSNVLLKSYNFRDFEAINEIKKKYTICFMSRYNQINYHLFNKKNIPFYWAADDKLNKLYKILNRYGVTTTELLYVGASYSDKQCLQLAEIGVCPTDSPESIKHLCKFQIDTPAGQGRLYSLYESLLKYKGN